MGGAGGRARLERTPSLRSLDEAASPADFFQMANFALIGDIAERVHASWRDPDEHQAVATAKEHQGVAWA